MTRAHLLSIRFADGAYGIRDSSVGGMVPKMNAHAGAFSSDSGRHIPGGFRSRLLILFVQQIGKLYRASANIGLAASLAELDCLGVAAAPGYGKSWIAFARQKFPRSGFDEHSNHLQ